MSDSNFASQEEREKSKNIAALRALVPFLWPYRLQVVLAGVALVVTAVLSLLLPVAVRRVVDGFETTPPEILDSYFIAALGLAGLIAIGGAVRFYVVTWIGERVVADIRKAVFERMIAMSPAFYERIMTGEVLSRITTDTTLILSVIGSSISVALRNILSMDSPGTYAWILHQNACLLPGWPNPHRHRCLPLCAHVLTRPSSARNPPSG
ncbi:MAG: ABC transporter transmembrane domain-containing protein, partial [Pseudomonadota bacterium]